MEGFLWEDVEELENLLYTEAIANVVKMSRGSGIRLLDSNFYSVIWYLCALGHFI